MGGSSAYCSTLCQRLSPQNVFLKIDTRNAFNSLRSDSHLSETYIRTSGLYSLLWQVYSMRSRLFFASKTSIQQKDPNGTAFFALSTDEAARGVHSVLNIWCLNDTTLSDSPERIHDDLVVFLERLIAIGSEVNRSSLNVSSPFSMTVCQRQRRPFSDVFFRVRVVEAWDFSLLGAPVDTQGIPETILYT